MRGSGRPASLAALLIQRGDVGLDGLGGGHPEDRAVGAGAGEAQHGGAHRGKHAGDGLGVGDFEEEIAAVLLALVLHALAVEQRHQDLEVLLHVARGTVEGHAEDALDHDCVGESDAEHEALPAACGLDRGGLLGHRVGVARVGRHDGGH